MVAGQALPAREMVAVPMPVALVMVMAASVAVWVRVARSPWRVVASLMGGGVEGLAWVGGRGPSSRARRRRREVGMGAGERSSGGGWAEGGEQRSGDPGSDLLGGSLGEGSIMD
jgi:hypothetical protein